MGTRQEQRGRNQIKGSGDENRVTQSDAEGNVNKRKEDASEENMGKH